MLLVLAPLRGAVVICHSTGGIVRKRRPQPPANGWHPCRGAACRKAGACL